MRSTEAHLRGEEFSYLSMFLERPKNGASDGDLDAMYQTYSLTPFGAPTHLSHRLQRLPHHHVTPLNMFDDGDDDVKPSVLSNTVRAAKVTGEEKPRASATGDTDMNTKDNAEKKKSELAAEVAQNLERRLKRKVFERKVAGMKRANRREEDGDTAESQHPAISRTEGTERGERDAEDDDDGVPQPAPTIEAKVVKSEKSRSRKMKRSHRQVEAKADEASHRTGEHIPRLRTMLKKLIRQYEITTIADVPCRAHAHWVPSLLRELEHNNQSVTYICVDSNRDVLSTLRKGLEEAGLKGKFVLRRFWKEGLPAADLVLSWAGLDNMGRENVARYFRRVAAAKGRHKVFVVGSHSGELLKSKSQDNIRKFTGGGRPMNVREKPFGLTRPVRIIKEMSVDGNDKQMYVYFPEMMFAGSRK